MVTAPIVVLAVLIGVLVLLLYIIIVDDNLFECIIVGLFDFGLGLLNDC